MREGVDARLRTALAIDIARADGRILLEINRARPRILLHWRIKQKNAPVPETEAEWAQAITDAKETARAAEFAEVVKFHLLSLGLPFESAWLEDFT